MKKALSLILALVLCLGLCACSSGEQNNQSQPDQTGTTEPQASGLNLCQEWKSIANGDVISFDETGKFYINGQTFLYEYDEDASKILVDAGVQVSLPVSLVDGIYRIDVEGEEFAPASEYERLHAEYAKTMIVVPGFDGTPALNAVLVSEHIDRVELTLDNWKEYITVYSYDVKTVKKDAFGEITNTEIITAYRLGYGTAKYYYLDAIIELKHNETGELTVYAPAAHQGQSFFLDQDPIDLEDYECTRIKGYLYFINYPDEVLEQVLNKYDRQSASGNNASIQITSSFMEGTWSVDCDSKVVENQSDSFSDYFD